MSLRNVLFGVRLASSEEEQHRVGTIAGIPMLGLDALGSSAYGPEAALTLLLPLGVLGLSYIVPISLLIIALLCIVYLSYRQTIAAYPTDGGSYTVARSNLGVSLGLLAAARSCSTISWLSPSVSQQGLAHWSPRSPCSSPTP
jgi:amino acid transporter